MKRDWVWVTRDNLGKNASPVGVWKSTSQPYTEDGEWHSESWMYLEMSAEAFKELFGFTPRMGSKRKMRLIVEQEMEA